MTKRQAGEALQDVLTSGFPVSKKARVEDTSSSQSYSATNGGSSHAIHVRSSSPHKIAERDNLKRPISTENPDLGKSGDQLEEENEEAGFKPAGPTRQTAPTEGYTDLYLDTINRKLLDFDFEKLCSITLSNINVYACLVCGKYFQGRGHKSHAYFHALEVGHHVYINMETQRVYVLPEGYEVKSGSLEDIKFVVDPRLSKDEVAKLDREAHQSSDLAGKKYVPGFVGMNNIKDNDYFNVVVQAISHIPPLRNFFMLENLSSRGQLVQRFSTLIRKIWNPRAFKSHVSPHELLQEISLRSNKRFTLTHQSDPIDFLSWFLNNMHLALGGSKTKPGSSIIQKIFQGKLKVESQQITAKADAGDRLRFEEAAEVKTDVNRYLMLTLDLPTAPLFQDELDRNIIPQVPLVNILSKYDGRTSAEYLSHRRRYRLLHPLPPYLLFHIKRFSSNKFVSERNPTIVTFPTRSLDMSPYVQPDPTITAPGEPICYDLVANVVHEAIRGKDDAVEGEKEAKVWKVQLLDRARDEWISIQDLYVENVRKEILFLGESYLQVWERRREPKKSKREEN